MSDKPISTALGGLSRRDLLRRAAAGGLVVGGAGLLAACDSDGDDSTSTQSGTPAEGQPRRGGALRVGIVGGTVKDIRDPHNAVSQAVYARNFNIFDLPGYRDPKTFEPDFRLVESAEPNKAADKWMVRLRQGVEFHNGKTLAPEDLIFTVERALESTYSAGAFNYWGIERMKKVDAQTVEFTFERPLGAFIDVFFQSFAGVVPVGFDPQKPVGTGPFKFKSFTPGQESVFERFENYWGDGPYVDTLRMVDFIDDSARINALLGGQVDAIDAVPASQVGVLESRPDVKLLRSKTGNLRMLTMRVDTPPFDDVRVRQAMRLLTDRQQIVDAAFAGNARVASDIFAPFDPCFRSDLNREHDPERAQSLLREAGHERLSVELVTSQVGSGLVEVSQVYAQQAKAAGVDVTVRKVDPSEMYARHYLQAAFCVDWWPTYMYLPTAAQAHRAGSGFNPTHFDDDAYNALFAKAIGEKDDDRRCEIIGDMQEIDFDRGGNLIWGYVDTVDASSDKIAGFYPDKNGYHLSTYDFKRISFV